MTTYPRYNVYKLTNPREQVGMPNTHKWAVGVERGENQGFGFYEAFETRRGALEFIRDCGCCTICGEACRNSIPFSFEPLCACEREAKS